ncbi:hypothetical protein N7478_007182 [Penicillium angulare]|uniref:uncharacterized protein n=1 Tax=Penicillium angulare TaxID=116970 RepID=UPI0025404429|nr:uncharacterized protein N7478_007182 [Penicillium angulare]KAJ5281810.1 hypothetical protein N7478_007182 [Penicillium angulare]
MPPLSAYTPFESLLFFQSLATHDVRPASFASISHLLTNNKLVRENVAFSADRLSPEALEDLYATLLRDRFNRETSQGPAGGSADSSNASTSNPKKRKISSPKPDGSSDGVTHSVQVSELVSHLYARYRELVTKEIKEDENKYDLIQEEIKRLSKEEQKPQTPIAPAPAPPAVPVKKPEQPELVKVDVKQEKPRRNHPGPITLPPTPATLVKPTDQSPAKPPVPVQAPKETQQPPAQLPAKPPATVSQSKPPQPAPAPPKTDPTAVQAPVAPPLAPRAQVAPATPTPSAAPRPVPAHPSQVAPRPPTAASPAVVKTPGPPIASAPISTPTQSSFQQWQLEPPPKSPYPAAPSNTTTPQISSTATKQPLPPLPQVPSAQHKPSISSTLPSTPGPLSSGAQTPVPIGHPRPSQTPSVVISAFSERRGSRPRLSIDTPGSSTPWKRTPSLIIPDSPVSPARPLPEDVSPISERAPSPDAMDFELSTPREKKTTRRGQATTDNKTPTIKTEKPSGSRRKRAESSASTRSRGRSAASRGTSPAQPDSDVRASKRQRGAAASPDGETPKGRSKRKRAPSESAEQESVAPEVPKLFDNPRYVMCARGFHRTAAPILNDVTTHKLASIFAKPLGERDAPGYHDLIYRPQDLKSIKSAVHQGSKAVAIATEAVSTPAGDGESPAPGVGASSKNNALMLPKSEELLPPKGIVNSAQLEKEFVRMFANAIMFNPVPERDFGPHFPMISDRGSRESTQSADGDEGGIIQDSREMFEDVEQAVNRWRAAERASERASDELAIKNILSLRRGSASDFNAESTDDAKG